MEQNGTRSARSPSGGECLLFRPRSNVCPCPRAPGRPDIAPWLPICGKPAFERLRPRPRAPRGTWPWSRARVIPFPWTWWWPSARPICPPTCGLVSLPFRAPLPHHQDRGLCCFRCGSPSSSCPKSLNGICYGPFNFCTRVCLKNKFLIVRDNLDHHPLILLLGSLSTCEYDKFGVESVLFDIFGLPKDLSVSHPDPRTRHDCQFCGTTFLAKDLYHHFQVIWLWCSP